MPKAAMFTMKLEADLRDGFMAAAEASHRPASQVVRELMREFVARERARRERAEFLSRKVDAARASLHEGHGPLHETVEADFATRRVGITDRA